MADNSAIEIELCKQLVSNPTLYNSPENPQVNHVEKQVFKICMEKHGCNARRIEIQPGWIPWHPSQVILNKLDVVLCLENEKDTSVDADQGGCDPRGSF